MMTNKDYINAMRDFCYDGEYKFLEKYSGRYMHGSCCVGLVCDNILETVCNLLVYIIDGDEELNADDVLSAIGYPKSDNMGRNYILYFPKLMV